jgi:hypothetical protein
MKETSKRVARTILDTIVQVRGQTSNSDQIPEKSNFRFGFLALPKARVDGHETVVIKSSFHARSGSVPAAIPARS